MGHQKREMSVTDNRQQQLEGKPVWVRFEKGNEPDREQCRQGNHTWIALFYGSGRLAYWQCEGCGETDRETERLLERLDWINGWINSPPRLMARGLKPPVSDRRWETTDGAILTEGDPSSIHFVEVIIPGLTEAHTYRLSDENGTIEEVFEPCRERPGEYSDHYWLTRYQVVGEVLVQFISHCFEESTYDTPYAHQPKQKKVLTGFRLLSDQ